jgi:hypothetical protein
VWRDLVDSGGLVMVIEGLAVGFQDFFFFFFFFQNWLGVWMWDGWQWIGQLLWKTIELYSDTKIDVGSGR